MTTTTYTPPEIKNPELTPERIRDAAEVLRLLDTDRPSRGPDYAWLPSEVEGKANALARKLAAEALARRERIDKLAEDMIEAAWPDLITPPGIGVEAMKRAAEMLIENYPVLETLLK